MYDSTVEQSLALADLHGTPLFVMSEQRLDAAIEYFTKFTDRLVIPADTHYSYKTNYLPALCEHIAKSSKEIGAEVTSLLEWNLARSLYPASKIVVNGIGKTAGLLDVAASAQPRLINVETDTEVDVLCRRSPTAPPINVGLRITIPGVSGESGIDPTIRWRRGQQKFGWRADGPDAIRVARRLAEHPSLRLEALQVHMGGQMVSARLYGIALDAIGRYLERLARIGIVVTTLDMGGGLASGWVEKRRNGPLFELIQAAGLPSLSRPQREPDLAGIATTFALAAARLRRLGVQRLLFEPGRFLAEPAMLAVATVIAVRRDGRRRHAVLDLGVNALHCWRSDEKRPVSVDQTPAGARLQYTLVGPLCHRGDTFGTINVAAPLSVGTKVCMDAVGAYTLGDWIANTWQRPPVVRLHDGALLWARQTPEQFWAPAPHGIPDRVEI